MGNPDPKGLMKTLQLSVKCEKPPKKRRCSPRGQINTPENASVYLATAGLSNHQSIQAGPLSQRYFGRVAYFFIVDYYFWWVGMCATEHIC